MSAQFAHPHWSTRLKLGLTILAVLFSLTIIGPSVAPSPTEIVDPRAGGVLPPGSRRTLVHRNDGTVLAAERVERIGASYKVVRRGKEGILPASEVAKVESRLFLFGTDALGRDVLARALHGGRVSLAIGTLALAATLVVGISLGLLAGWSGGLADSLIMRAVDALLAVPMIFFLLLLAAIFRPSLAALVLVLAASAWMGVARLVRGQVLSLKQREFILAACGIGASPVRIAVTHLLPNALTPIAQDGALRLADLVLTEAALSFLGLGVQPPVPSWGNMVAEGQDMLATAWWLTFVPGMAVVVTVIAAALVADGLSELSRQRATSGT